MNHEDHASLLQRIAELEAQLEAQRDALREAQRAQAPRSAHETTREDASSHRSVSAAQRLQAILSRGVDFAIIATDRDGVVTDWNVGAASLFGWSAEAMAGASVQRIFTHDDQADGQLEREMSDALARGRSNDERWHLREDGTRFWASGETMPLHATDGTHIGYLKIVRDRTAEHRTGIALSEAAASKMRTDRFQGALLDLSDQLRDLTAPEDISQAAIAIIGRVLDLDMVGYGDVDSVAETIRVDHEWTSEGAQRVRGELHFRDFGSYVEDLKNAVMVSIEDVTVDPRTAEHADALIAKNSAAFVNMPIFERGEFVAMLFVGKRVPRPWPEDELVFIREVAERVRVAAERCRAEIGLKASEAQFRAFAQAMPNHVWAAHANGDFYWVNQRVQLYTGEPPERFYGTSQFSSVIHPGDHAKVNDAWQFALSTGRIFQCEFRIRRHDGMYRWFLVRALPASNEAGAVTGWIGTSTDIHEQRRQSDELEKLVGERTADRNALWELSSDIMLRSTFEGRMTAVNPAWADVLGWREDELIGANLFDLLHPDDLDRTREAAKSLAQGGTLARFDNRYRHRDGTYRWISWSATPGDDLINAVGRDVTPEVQQSVALKDSMDFTRLALTAVGGVGVWTYDVASDRFTCDAAIADLYAIDATEGAAGILRERFLANVHPDDRTALKNTMSGGLIQDGDLELEYRICHPHGEVRWVLSRGHTYFDHDNRPVRRTGVGVEVTRQRQLEEQLRQSQKMEAVGQLTGGLAHDFNNLLTGITGSLDLLRVRIAQGRTVDIERYVTAAQGAAKRAAALTHRLLAFSRRQTLDPKPIDVNRLVIDMEDLIRRTVGPAVDMAVAAETGLWSTRVDPNQLENALLNLCINARDAMPDGGRITIETRNRDMDDRAAREHDLRPGQYVALSVTDTGVGMSADVIAKAFDPFFTTKPMGSGTGLGLSMTYGFAMQSGGQVRIVSEPGEGATVTVYLPRHTDAAHAEPSPAQTINVPRAREGETVLVVDDEPAVRMLVVEVLQELGYRALEAGDGAAGLAVLQSGLPVDLLVTDVGLPGGMNGRQMADAARVDRPGLKVLFITGYAENAVIRSGHLDPGMHVMTKPFAIEVLAARVREIIETR